MPEGPGQSFSALKLLSCVGNSSNPARILNSFPKNCYAFVFMWLAEFKCEAALRLSHYKSYQGCLCEFQGFFLFCMVQIALLPLLKTFFKDCVAFWVAGNFSFLLRCLICAALAMLTAFLLVPFLLMMTQMYCWNQWQCNSVLKFLFNLSKQKRYINTQSCQNRCSISFFFLYLKQKRTKFFSGMSWLLGPKAWSKVFA